MMGKHFKVSGKWDSINFFHRKPGLHDLCRRDPGLDEFCHREPGIDDFSDREPGILAKIGHQEPGKSKKGQRVAVIESLRMF